MKPTQDVYNSFQKAYSHFNIRMFQNLLPDCLITMQRQARSYGYYCSQRFVNRQGDHTDEIALNPRFFMSRSESGVLSTLAHEMAHLWQYHFANSGRSGYHNRQWADEMIRIGLHPSNTGQVGGRETGYQMTHYVINGGLFEHTCNELIDDGYRLSWLDDSDFLANLVGPRKKRTTDGSNCWKYTSPKCRQNAWARPRVSLICGNCRSEMPHNR